MTESTAAAMAYGLFVSRNVSPPALTTDGTSKDGDTTNTGGKNILVFDMGGGTTDVTIASIDFAKTTEKVQFRVVATAGDRCLGGDNVDELLARHLWKLHAPSSSTSSGEGTIWKASEHQEFTNQCRRAKADLCGNDNDDDGSSDVVGMDQTQVTLHGKTIRITRQEFDSAIQPLIDRAAHVIDDALSALEQSHHHDHSSSCSIHEVVLVGGSTHIPTIRSMLRQKFPPPIPPELCTSISAETAVAQGLAIQAALVSGVVPLWELRNAMMLDVLLHSIGVWISDNGRDDVGNHGTPFTKGQIIQPNSNSNGKQEKGHYVPILHKDAPLPAMGSATFTLAAANQFGITVIAAEHIGPGDVYQCMGVFDFLLHRPDKEDNSNDDQGARQVEVGMTLEISGKFIVSVFDKTDPEHREKRRRYLKEKALRDGKDDTLLEEEIVEKFYEEEEERSACSGTEIGLVLFCVVLFALYVAARIAFNDVDMSHENDEL